MLLCLCAELHMLLPTGFPFQREPAASMVEGEGATEVWDSGLLTCVVWCTLYLLSSEMHSLRTPRSEKREVRNEPLGCGMAAFPCHTPSSPSLLPRAHTNTCCINKKSGPVLSVEGPHTYFLYQSISVKISEFSMFSRPGTGIPQWFIWSSMRILEDV